MANPHTPDAWTGNCSACGTTREEIDDNLAPECFPETGPHAEALITLRVRHRRLLGQINMNRKFAREAEDAVVKSSHQIRDLEARSRELEASIAALRQMR